MADAHRPRGRQYRWKGDLWRTPHEIQDEIGYVGPERQDKYTRYGWNHTVAEVMATGVHRTDIPLYSTSDADRRRVAAILRRLRIEPLAERPFLTLSYGERRLTLLARSLASRPKMLLLDELLNGLDEANHERARRWLEGTARSTAALGVVHSSAGGCPRERHARIGAGARPDRVPGHHAPRAADPMAGAARGDSRDHPIGLTLAQAFR